MTDRSTLGRRSRNKGAHFECEIVRLLKDAGITGIYTTRSRQSRRDDSPDIDGTLWAIECGTGKAVKPLAKLEQAEAAAVARGDDRPCVAICRKYGSRSITATTRLCCICRDCDDEDNMDPVTVSVETWVKYLVRVVKAQAGRAAS